MAFSAVAVLSLATLAHAATGDAVDFLWPMPDQVTLGSGPCYTLDPAFTFSSANKDDVLTAAFARYTAIIKNLTTTMGTPQCTPGGGALATLTVNVAAPAPAQPLVDHTDESYALDLTSPTSASLSAPTVWGALRGLETFSQCVFFFRHALAVQPLKITDQPAFTWRGSMIDSSRVFRPMWELKNIVDVMAGNRMNVLHVHLTDNQGWTVEIKSYPDLTAKCSDGHSMGPHGTYTQADMKDLVEYARVRGVRVVPEIDSPGHWNTEKCYPDILATHSSGSPPDPSNPATWTFFQKVLGEMAQMFPDKYFHVGGDEFSSKAWSGSSKIQAWAKANKLSSIAEIEGWYQSKIKGILTNLTKNTIAWTPGICDSPGAPTLTHMVWHGGRTAMNDVQHYTSLGEQVVLSDSNWYVHNLSPTSAIATFNKYYSVNVHDWPGDKNATQAKLLLGGAGCVWGDLNKGNEFQSSWPLLSSVAEIWWSPADVAAQGPGAALPRYRVHNERMQARGLPTMSLPAK